MKRSLPISICLLFLLSCLSTLAEDPTTGTITGIILDAQGNPANDVIVVAQQAAQKMREPLQTTTNEKGVFKLEKVPEGEYNLKIRTRDLKSKAAKTVNVIAGKTADIGKLKLKST